MSSRAASSPTLLSRHGVQLMLFGVGTEAMGLGVDAWLHLHNPQLAHQEALFTFSNPGHALLIIGMGVALFGAFLVVAGRWVCNVTSRPLRALILFGVVAQLAGIGVVASRSGLGAHHDAVTVATATHLNHAASPSATSNPAQDHSHTDTATSALPLDPPTEAKLESEIATARSVALRYPRLADALRAGYTQALEYGPGLGSHYMKYQLTFAPFDVAQPAMLLYSGDSPDSVVVGVMYYVYSSEGPPAGFAGNLDQWHQHPQTCVGPKGAYFSGDPEGFRACGRRGIDAWMLHVWCVPGWESVLGVFSEENPKLL